MARVEQGRDDDDAARFPEPAPRRRHAAAAGAMNDDVEALVAALPRGARVLGVDLGTKTIGLALSDIERRIATPLETIKRVKFTPDVGRIKELVERYEVGGLVFGLPLNMDGTEGPRSQ